MSEEILRMPVIALRGLAILPGTTLHFDISRERSVQAAEAAMMGNQKLFTVAQRDPLVMDPDRSALYTVGTIVNVKQLVKLPNKLVRVLVEANVRARLESLSSEGSYLTGEVLPMEEAADDMTDEESEAGLRVLRETLFNYSSAAGGVNIEIIKSAVGETSLDQMMLQVVLGFQLDCITKQSYLEADTQSARFKVVMEFLSKEMEINRIKEEIGSKVKERLDQNQREYILREQMQVIREELGEDDMLSDADSYMEDVKKLTASDDVKEKIRKEIKKFRSLGFNSAENSVERTHIETLLEMPWDLACADNDSIDRAEEILNRDHYGLEEVKERILEFLSVRILSGAGAGGPIICLVGPPGTGKTSIAQSIATALGKPYVRISLGGIRDEAEIRGHRKTYIGAMPGRIATGLKQAGVKNPLMLLDEIDKVGSDYHGDPSSALLEVLDSEQNFRFRDNYIEIPLDLSQVLFIATANTTQTIPAALLDRMEVIELSGYTENEKLHIAKEHLVPKQLDKNAIPEGKLKFTDDALLTLARNYTREAGVRNLERRIGQICRKAAREIVQGGAQNGEVTPERVRELLGKEIYTVDPANEKNEIGIVRGLAWTSAGGETLQIEVNIMPGKGEILLTGSIGDVMKESAKAGLSYIRGISTRYGLEADYFEKHDIHIHIPEGAVPKDGPSAGITMATAMLSAMIQVPVDAGLAMTGEITLRGRVLPIGGLKEKTLAAKAAGIKKVLVPEKNRPDIDEMSDEIKSGLKIVFVRSMDDVLKEALVLKKSRAKAKERQTR